MAGDFGFLTPYPPTQSGLATFSATLRRHLIAQAPGSRAEVVRVIDDGGLSAPAEVVFDLLKGSLGNAVAAADVLNGFDVVIVQHEYGLYGGRDGEELLDLLELVDVPVIVVLHAVLAQPSRHQRAVLTKVVERADAVVTMSDAAAQRLLDGYTMDPAKLSVIPHGAPADGLATAALTRARPVILTWGLLGPEKGIESAIAAMSSLRDLAPRYVVAGQTHPKALTRTGRSYYDTLRAQASACGVADMVEFIPSYLNAHTLGRLIRQASVVLLPYTSTTQVTSGVLVEAVAARRPVVATRFPHAVEMLAGGCGLLVPHEDPQATSQALRRVLTEPGLAVTMADKAASLAPGLRWPVVAERYRALADSLVTAGTGALR
nr:glycosyltransferase [Kibdelosporangium sp. MJ126-NF4]CEL20835.1 Glycosyltransferase [Kibdelosporangium sp. MJ126-NF4]CTQ98360.1 Glycosyltransferase (EC 2.4.1.-) [Kibdelosporangium sp. MJ126-NF4]